MAEQTACSVQEISEGSTASTYLILSSPKSHYKHK